MPSQAFAYAALTVAILCEVAGTTFLQKSEQFYRLAPTLLMAAFYAGALYLMTQDLKVMPLGITSAIWSGVGVVLTAVVGATVFKQALDGPAMAGIAMIVAGVAVMQVFSTSTGH